ncbi:MAG: hypothetical protein Ct9H300mP25_12200 [Acidobacteriota bacterium]|nr:MAG: hypothetical protein Ct9H300mP25_12200 [Acidobacteriota bacterium]
MEEAIEDPDGYVTAEAPEISGEVFALRVQGESMIGAGIFSGDLYSYTANRQREVVTLL